MAIPNPHDLRIAARQAAYPNSMVERETIDAVDEQVLDRARMHDRYLAERADLFADQWRAEIVSAGETRIGLRTGVREPLSRGEGDLQRSAKSYSDGRRAAEASIARLKQAVHRADLELEQLRDPYAALVHLWERWPSTRFDLR